MELLSVKNVNFLILKFVWFFEKKQITVSLLFCYYGVLFLIFTCKFNVIFYWWEREKKREGRCIQMDKRPVGHIAHWLLTANWMYCILTAKWKQPKLEDVLNLLSVGFLKGGIGSGNINREIRVGVTHVS